MFIDEETGYCDVSFLPIAAAYARELGLMEEVDRLCPKKEGVSVGRVVLALVLDTLLGRKPLYRLPETFEGLDTELLLGEQIPAPKLNDDVAGRALDLITDVGTGSILLSVVIRAVKGFDLNTSVVHHDTTSHSVYGDFDLFFWGGRSWSSV